MVAIAMFRFTAPGKDIWKARPTLAGLVLVQVMGHVFDQMDDAICLRVIEQIMGIPTTD